MKIPKEIQEAIRNSATAFNIARDYEKIIRDWLNSKGHETDAVHDTWIDCIENGTGQDEDFIEFIKKL